MHDDSSVNAIQVKWCSITRDSGYWDYYEEGPWGQWSRDFECPDNQYIYGMVAKYHPDSGDGVGLTALKFNCRDLYGSKETGPHEARGENGTPPGYKYGNGNDWGEYYYDTLFDK